jgi:hypothetical protein
MNFSQRQHASYKSPIKRPPTNAIHGRGEEIWKTPKKRGGEGCGKEEASATINTVKNPQLESVRGLLQGFERCGR